MLYYLWCNPTPDYGMTVQGSPASSWFSPCQCSHSDITKSLKLRKSSEMAHCRDHPFRSFRTPRNEDSHSMKPLSTSESPETILLTFESPGTSHCQSLSSETYTAHSQKSWHSFTGRALVLPGLVNTSTALPSMVAIRMKQFD